TPPETPRFFSASEGGKPVSSWEIPGWSVASLGVGLGIGMIASGDASRWYHAKGMAQSLATGGALTGALKILVGRHRPDWSPTNDTPDERESFPSGHSMMAFSIATYSILYLHGHVFDTRKTWLEPVAYGGIVLGATALAAER